MKINKNLSLKPYNQFGVDVSAKYFTAPENAEEVKEIITNPDLKREQKIILGGGNNVLFVDDYDGLVIKPEITGREVIDQDDQKVLLKVGAGEDWDKLVRWTVDQGWGGMENLVEIPAVVGGAVSQNIGAYGQEVADVVEKIETINLDTGQEKVFTKKDCQFEYRSSVFKDELKNKFLITYVYLKLIPEDAGYEMNYDYASLKKELEKQAEPPFNLKQIMEAVASQRANNLPNINHYGSCGCFFTNPVVKNEKFEQLKEELPDLVSYPCDKGDNWVKIPAGKLVDECGWKGHWEENVGVSEKHALCLVTEHQASGKEILDLANKIREDVAENYGVDLEFEVNVLR